MRIISKYLRFIIAALLIAFAFINNIQLSDTTLLAISAVLVFYPLLKKIHRVTKIRNGLVSVVALLLIALSVISLPACTDISDFSLFNTPNSSISNASPTPSLVPQTSHKVDEDIDGEQSHKTPVDPSTLSKYSGSPYVVVNDNKPIFSEQELIPVAYEKYSNLDSLGRCGPALLCCGKEIMPESDEERGSISSVYPSGWKQKYYDGLDQGWLWNRCHLAGWQLSAENANEKNLITGTRYMNVEGMLPFENEIAEYVRKTNNHVAYRISPIFEGRNLVCSGVQMEAYSIEDEGSGICFSVYCYNVTGNNIVIDYATGDSWVDTNAPATPSPTPNVSDPNAQHYVLNTNSKKIHRPECDSASKISDKNRKDYTGDINDLLDDGYTLCGTCF